MKNIKLKILIFIIIALFFGIGLVNAISYDFDDFSDNTLNLNDISNTVFVSANSSGNVQSNPTTIKTGNSSTVILTETIINGEVVSSKKTEKKSAGTAINIVQESKVEAQNETVVVEDKTVINGEKEVTKEEFKTGENIKNSQVKPQNILQKDIMPQINKEETKVEEDSSENSNNGNNNIYKIWLNLKKVFSKVFSIFA